MPETGQDVPSSQAPPPPPPPKESPFSIKNLLNGDHPKAAPKQPRALFPPVAKGALEGAGFALSPMGDLAFPRCFEIPAQRFALPAHYLERSPAWWYPYSLTPAGGHLPRPEGTGETPPPPFPPSPLSRGEGGLLWPGKRGRGRALPGDLLGLRLQPATFPFLPGHLLPRAPLSLLCSPQDESGSP